MGRHRIQLERIQTDPIDFVQIMVELYNAGCNYNMVSRHLDISPASVLRWSKGGQPFYNNGAALLKLHQKYCHVSPDNPKA